MTNETLCELIQDGNTELTPTLWEQTEQLFYLQARKWFFQYPNMCKRAGVELDDLKQECYFAFIDTIRYYRREDGIKFLTFARFPVKTRFNAMLGLRTEAQSKLPLNNYINIDKPIEDGLMLVDTLEDDTAAEGFENVESRMDAKRLREVLEVCIDRLKPEQAEAVRCRYFKGMSYKEIGDRLGVSHNVAKGKEWDGIKALRRGKNATDLKAWRDDIISMHAHRGGFGSWRNTGCSAVEYTVLKIESEAERLAY